ncbi:hypothetical protein BG003_003737 [Podila horticola]|nr:hypothetical protein BG003_003737 [Podila horticola]
MGKKVLSSIQTEDGVLIQCSDNTTYEGDLLVGVDGAYSVVRQQLKDLKKEGKLPRSDDVPLPFNSVCLVGQTEVLDSDEFPDLKREYSQFSVIHSRQEFYSWMTFTTKANTMCWIVIQFLDAESSTENDSFRNSEWGSEWGLRPPKPCASKFDISKCQELNPSGGAGALTAMNDTVAVANWVSSLEGTSLAHVKAIFQEYYSERFPIAKETFATTQKGSCLTNHEADIQAHAIMAMESDA